MASTASCLRENRLVLNPLARSSYWYEEDGQRLGKGVVMERVDLLREERFRGPEEVKRERLPFQSRVLALHDRRSPFQAQFERGVIDPK